jgi:hypothetical protein
MKVIWDIIQRPNQQIKGIEEGEEIEIESIDFFSITQ